MHNEPKSREAKGVSSGDYMSSLKGKKVVIASVKGVAKVLRVMGIREGV